MTTLTKKIVVTKFSKTRLVEVECHKMLPSEDHEEVLWVERSEALYALMSPQLRDKKVAILYRESWLRGKDV